MGKLPYINSKKLYAAVMGACSYVRETGYFNKARSGGCCQCNHRGGHQSRNQVTLRRVTALEDLKAYADTLEGKSDAND